MAHSDGHFESMWRGRFERFAHNHADEHLVSGWSAEGLKRRRRLLERLAREIPLRKRATVLELGCGAGTYVRFLADLNHSVVGVDYSLPSLARAVDADPQRTGDYVAADGYCLPFRATSFDLVICVGVMQVLEQPERLVDEIVRVLRPRGIVVVETLNAQEIPTRLRIMAGALAGRDPRVRVYRPDRVERLLEERGLAVLERRPLYLPPPRLPALGRLLEKRGVSKLLGSVPGASLAVAHAFWFVARRSA